MRRLATLALASALEVLALASFTFTATDAAGDSFADGPGTAVAHEAATDVVTHEATDAVPAGESLYERLLKFEPDTRALAQVESKAVAGAWSAIGKPWPSWAPCDSAAVFANHCAPRRPARTEVVVPEFCMSAQGLGKNIFKYSVVAAARFRNGTGVVFDETYVRNTPKSGGRFRIHSAFLPATHVPTKGLGDPAKFSREPASGCGSGGANEYGIFKCAVYAVTRPLRNVTQALDAAAPDGWLTGRTATLPTVGLHLRSGWVDFARLWNATACGAYRDVFPDAAGSLPGLRKNETLRESLANLADAADAAFGERRWRVYVAADAPALKSYIARVLGPRCARVGFTTAPLFHSQFGRPPRYAQAADLALAADFVALAQSDIFLAAGDSSYSAASEVRALCPQRRFAGYGNVAKYSIAARGPGFRWLAFDILANIWSATAGAGRQRSPAQTDGTPQAQFAPDHPCRAAAAAAAGGDKADEAEACQCFLQLALTGAAPSG